MSGMMSLGRGSSFFIALAIVKSLNELQRRDTDVCVSWQPTQFKFSRRVELCSRLRWLDKSFYSDCDWLCKPPSSEENKAAQSAGRVCTLPAGHVNLKRRKKNKRQCLHIHTHADVALKKRHTGIYNDKRTLFRWVTLTWQWATLL